MTPLNKLRLGQVHRLSSNSWLAHGRNRHYLISADGTVTQIKSPFSGWVYQDARYEKFSGTWCVGTYENYFVPFWSEKELPKKKRWLQNGGDIPYRHKDHIVCSADSRILSYNLERCCILPAKLRNQIKLCVTKDKNVVTFLDLETTNFVNLACPFNVESGCFSWDGLTALVYGPKGFVIIDNPLDF